MRKGGGGLFDHPCTFNVFVETILFHRTVLGAIGCTATADSCAASEIGAPSKMHVCPCPLGRHNHYWLGYRVEFAELRLSASTFTLISPFLHWTIGLTWPITCDLSQPISTFLHLSPIRLLVSPLFFSPFLLESRRESHNVFERQSHILYELLGNASVISTSGSFGGK